LRAKLNAVFVAALGPAAFVLDRKWPFRAAAGHGMKLDYIGPTGEAEAHRADRYAKGTPDRISRLGPAAIDPLMRDPPFRLPAQDLGFAIIDDSSVLPAPKPIGEAL
jgi:hypothetical protein